MKNLYNVLFILLILAFISVSNLNAQILAYGVDGSTYPVLNFVSVPIPAGTPFTIIGPTAAGGQGGDFGADRVFYSTASLNLITISLTDGNPTDINTITGLSAGQSIIGMGYDPVSSTMYLASTNLTITGSELYTINLTTAVATLVGQVTNAPTLLAIAVNCDGEIYGIDVANDNLLSINPSSGAGTIIGPLSFDAGLFAQDADFDFATGILYWTTFNGTSGELRTVDVQSGNSTLITTWGADLIAFAIDQECSPTGVQEGATEVPLKYTLFQNYPNPFNPSTTISFEIKESSDVTLEIYNIKGQLVRTLVKGKLIAGNHSFVWNGRDDRARLVPSGLYISRMSAGEFVDQRKMLLIK
ncbi:MAG: FlgD immunoglobulin-like domain containing protein [bacterium]